MNKLAIAFVAAVSITTVGCKKKGDDAVAKSAEQKGAEPKTADVKPAPAAPKPTCSATAWKEPGGAFCVEAAGFKAGEVSKGEGDDPEMKVRFTQTDKPELMFDVSWYPKRDAATTAVTDAANMDNDFKANAGTDKGEFFGGKGRFVTFARKDNAKSTTLYAVVQGAKAAYHCEASSYDGPIAPALIAACKSIIPTD